MTTTMNGHAKFKSIDFSRCPGHTEAVTSRAEVIESWPEGDPRKAWHELVSFRDEWKNTRAPAQHHLFQLQRLFRNRYWEQVTYDNGRAVFRSFEDLCYRMLHCDPVDVLLRFQGLCGGQAPLEMLPNLLPETRTKFLRTQMDAEEGNEKALLEAMAHSNGGDRRSEEFQQGVTDQRECYTHADQSAERTQRKDVRAHLAAPEWVRDLEVQNLITAKLAQFLGSTSVRNAEDYDQRIHAFHEAALESLPEPGASRDEITDCRRKLEQIVRTIFPSAPATVVGGPLVVRLSPTDPADTAARIAAKAPNQDYLRTLAATLNSYLVDGAEPVPAAAVQAAARAERRAVGGARQPFSNERVLAFAKTVQAIQLNAEDRTIAQSCCEGGESWDGWMAFLSHSIPADSLIRAGDSLGNLVSKWPVDHDLVRVRSVRVENPKLATDSGLFPGATQAKRVYLLKVL